MVMRQQVWIDRHVQGVLVGRVLIYWSGIVFYFALSTLCTNWWQYPEWALSDHLAALVEYMGPCLPTLILLLPLVIFDIVRLSNRFAGPIYRLRNHLARLNEDTRSPALNFRDDDYWQQLADPINALQQKILSQEEQLAALSFVHKSLVEAGVDLKPATTPVVAPANDGYVSIAADDTLLSELAPAKEIEPLAPPLPVDTVAAEPFVTTAS